MRHARPVTTLLLLLALAAAAAACGSDKPSSGDSVGPGSSGPAATASDAASGGSGGPTASEPVTSEEPSDTGSPEATEPAGSDGPSASPGESPGTGIADACSGSTENRQFFTSVARAVDWPVLCGVLPAHWFVSSGSYRLANGGKMLISYKGPAGATLALSEGSFCADATGCVPSGTDSGDAALGTMAGTLVTLDDGGFAIVVDRGANPSWLLVTHGLDEATTVSLGGALAEVAG